MDVNEALHMLNKAYADEWLVHYQYWIGAKIRKGPMKDAVNAELLQHAAETLNLERTLSDPVNQACPPCRDCLREMTGSLLYESPAEMLWAVGQ